MSLVILALILAMSRAAACAKYKNPVVVIHQNAQNVNKDATKVKTNDYSPPQQVYIGCGHFKSCLTPAFGDQNSCLLDMSCSIVFALGKQPISLFDKHLPDPEDKSEIVLEIYARSSGWVAFALSEDHDVGNDLVFECIRPNNVTTATGTRVAVSYSWNWKDAGQSSDAHRNRRLTRRQISKAARIVNTAFDANSMYCMFYIQRKFEAKPDEIVLQYDLDSVHYCIFTAFSDYLKPAGAGGDIGTHNAGGGRKGGYGGCASQSKLDERFMPSRKEVKMLQIHGCILSVTYVALTCIPIFIARYYKQTLSRISYQYPTWLWLHASLSLLASLAGIGGGILGTVAAFHWNSMSPSPAHKFIGGFSIALHVVNIASGIYIRRTEQNHHKHAIFYCIHNISGHFALIAGILVIILTFSVETAFAACATSYTAVAFLFVYLVIHVTMSVNRIWINKCMGDTTPRDYTVTPLLVITQVGPMDSTWDNEPPKASFARLVVLVIFSLFCLSVSGLIVYFVISSESSCTENDSHWNKVRKNFNKRKT